MTGQVLTLAADYLTEPLPYTGIIDVIVVNPALVAGVVGRIYVDTADLALILRQKRFQSREVIAVNYHVAVGFAVFILRIKHTVRHVHVMIDDFILAYPVECRHFGHAPLYRDKCFTYYYSIVRRDFQPLRRKNGNNSLRVAPGYNTVRSKLDLIGEIAVDNVVNRLIFQLDVKLDSLDLALEFALIIGFNCLFYFSEIILIAAELDLYSFLWCSSKLCCLRILN
jgi:hypothetical protein